jgi:hypothetical protein
MVPDGPNASIVLGPFTQMLLDPTEGPKLGTTGPTNRSMDVSINFRPCPVFAMGMSSKGLASLKSHVALMTDVANRVYDEWVP